MIPDTVNVGGIDYKTQEVKDLMSDMDLYGQVNYHNNKIVIDDSMDEQRKEVVFVHELFHAILFEAGYDEHDEEMVRRVSNVLYQVLKDNEFNFNGEG